MEKKILKPNNKFKIIYRFLAVVFLVVAILQLLRVFKIEVFSENFRIALTMFQVFYIGFICAIALLDKERLKLL